MIENGNKRTKKALAGLLAALLLAGCGSAKGEDTADRMTQSAGYTNSMTGGAYYDYDYGLETSMSDSKAASEEYRPEGSQSSVELSQRKLIRTVYMEVETKEYDRLLDTLESQVQSIGGYIEDMESYNGSSYRGSRNSRYANLTIRIPKEKLDGFLDLVSDVGNVVRRSENVNDVTLSYVDLESHRNALRTEQERLLALLEKAESIEDIITIEGRLSDVRYQLESMESRLRTIDNQVDYSTVNLNVSEVQELTPVEKPGVWERITGGFKGSLKDIGQGAEDLFVWFLVNLPYLAIWAAVIAIAVLFIRWRLHKAAARKAARRTQTEGSDAETEQNTN